MLLLHKYFALQLVSLSTQTRQFPVLTLVNVHAWDIREIFGWSLRLSAFASVASTFCTLAFRTQLSCYIEVTGVFGVFSVCGMLLIQYLSNLLQVCFKINLLRY